MIRRRRNPWPAGVYATLYEASSDALAPWMLRFEDEVKEVIARAFNVGESKTLPVLDVSDGIVLRDTDRSQNEIIKGAPLRFQWSRAYRFWFVPRSKDKVVSNYTVRNLTDYFLKAGMPVRVVGWAEKQAEAEEEVEVAQATGPSLASMLTQATGNLSSDVWQHQPYVQRYEADARTALGFLPPGFRIQRRTSSRYGQVFVFVDREGRLLTQPDFERLGGKERAEAHIAAQRGAAIEQAETEAEAKAREEASLLEAARGWTGPQGLKVWQIESRAFRSIMGIEQPHIGEISGLQYARMSDRAKRAYDEKRQREWSASAAGAERWQRMVEALALAGDITPTTEGISPEARSVVLSATQGRRAQEIAAEQAKAERDRQRAVAAAASVARTEQRMSVEDRVSEIQNAVTRGIRRETRATGKSGGMIAIGDARVRLTIVGKPSGEGAWGLDFDPYRHSRSGDRTSATGSFTESDTAETVARAIFDALNVAFPPPEASADYLGQAKRAKSVFGATKKTGRADDMHLTIPTVYADVDVTLITTPKGYKVYSGHFYSHHSRAPIAVAEGMPPVHALTHVAAATREWAYRYGEMQAEVERLETVLRGMLYTSEPERWRAVRDELDAAKKALAELR